MLRTFVCTRARIKTVTNWTDVYRGAKLISETDTLGDSFRPSDIKSASDAAISCRGTSKGNYQENCEKLDKDCPGQCLRAWPV